MKEVPKIALELPAGDTRTANVYWSEMRGDTLHLCISVGTPAQPAQQPAPAAAAAEWLEQAFREGWSACRDAEFVGEEAEDWAFGNSQANSRMLDIQQAAPQPSPTPQADSQPAPPTDYPTLPEPSATGLGDEYEAFDRTGRAMGKAYETILYFKADQMRAYVDADRAARKQGGKHD